MADTAEATAEATTTPSKEEPGNMVAASPLLSPFKKLFLELRATVYKDLPVMPIKYTWDYFVGRYEASMSSTEEPANEVAASQASFPFMKLSAELRTMVLKELLVMPGDISWDYFTRCYSGSTSGKAAIKQAPLCQIFLVSKAVYREAVPIYFGSNLFTFESLGRFESFACGIGPDARWQLRKVSVDYAGYAPARAVKSLVQCMGLKELEITVHWWSWSRGLEKLQVNSKDCYHLRGHPFDLDWPEFIKTLEVLKQPHDPRTLKRQEAKDFPQKAKRTVFGKANVVTRSEKKMFHEQSHDE